MSNESFEVPKALTKPSAKGGLRLLGSTLPCSSALTPSLGRLKSTALLMVAVSEKPSSVFSPPMSSASTAGVPGGTGRLTVPLGPVRTTSLGKGMTVLAGSNVTSAAVTMLNVQRIATLARGMLKGAPASAASSGAYPVCNC